MGVALPVLCFAVLALLGWITYLAVAFLITILDEQGGVMLDNLLDKVGADDRTKAFVAGAVAMLVLAFIVAMLV